MPFDYENRSYLLFILKVFNVYNLTARETMGIYCYEQDFADRHYKWFGGRQHFAYLVKMAKKYGVMRCDQIIAEMKQELGWENDKPRIDRIKYFNAVLQKREQ